MTFQTVEQLNATIASLTAENERLRKALKSILTNEDDIKRLQRELSDNIARLPRLEDQQFEDSAAVFAVVISASALLTRAEQMVQIALQSKGGGSDGQSNS